MKGKEAGVQVLSRFYTYQKERFPLKAHVPLILAFSFCAVSFSSRLRVEDWPDLQAIAVAFICSLLFFLQLRIADEFKDFEEDSRWRPYRAVPRGLVTLQELKYLFVGGCLVQLGMAIWWSKWLLVLLLITWMYLTAMSFEFGAREWLKARPITYLWTHMLIMPLIDLFATAADWSLDLVPRPPEGLFFFLMASFFNGIVIEIGRKIRVPVQEEEGVETYSRLWGAEKAGKVWLVSVVLTALCGSLAAMKAQAFIPVAMVLWAGVILLGFFVYSFSKEQTEKKAKLFEMLAGGWTMILYLSLGVLPGVMSYV